MREKPFRGRMIAMVCVVLAVQATGWFAAAGRAADFRVENAVFVDDEEEPALRSSTIFHRGVVYDFLNDPAEVIIFDPAGARFILLDVDRKLRTDLSPTLIRQAIDRLKQVTQSAKDERTRFLGDPGFEQSVDEETGELVFESRWMSYRVLRDRADSAEVVRQYRESSDWYARLNTFLRPGSRPPFARLLVNKTLADRDEIPTRIVFTLRERRGLRTREDRLRSEHHFVKRLVESDLRRVAQAGEQMATFKTVPFREYEEGRRAKEAEAAKKAKSRE